MKRFTVVCCLVIMLFLGVGFAFYTQTVAAQTPTPIPSGGAIYDNWLQVPGIKKSPDTPTMPLWDRQSTNTMSGLDTWRCISCHGWDYQGKDGTYRSGSNFTGFPGVMQAGQSKSADEIVAILKGQQDAEHNFSDYLTDEQMTLVAQFIKQALVNDDEYIDPVTLKVIGGDATRGKQLYDTSCSNNCHGPDGTAKKFRFEGIDASLGTLANLDPWRFLHKTRFGTPGTPMVIGYDLGWSAQEGRDVLLYVQSLPSVNIKATPGPVNPSQTAAPLQGGPAQNWFTGLLTAIGAIATGLGFNLIVAAVLIGILLLIVWAIRGRK